MGAKVATKIGICVSKSGCFNCPIALWPCVFCIPEVTLIYAMPLKRRLLGRMLAYLRQLVHDSSHAERAPPTKIGAAINLRRPEARRPLVSQGEGTGGGMGGQSSVSLSSVVISVLNFPISTQVIWGAQWSCGWWGNKKQVG